MTIWRNFYSAVGDWMTQESFLFTDSTLFALQVRPNNKPLSDREGSRAIVYKWVCGNHHNPMSTDSFFSFLYLQFHSIFLSSKLPPP